MDDLRTGGVIRVLRRRRGWRQADLADRAGVSQSQVSLAERGHLASLRVRIVRAIGGALDLALPFDPHWRGADLAKLLDQDHATLVEIIVSQLQGSGWEVLVEYSFNHYGDRGVVDVVGWHAATRTLLIVEVKTRIVDIQELLGTLGRKCRVVPMLLARERGWNAASVGRVVVIADATAARKRVSDHAATFSAALPDRTREVRRWARKPVGPMAGLWFVRLTSPGDGERNKGGPHRVRVPATGLRRLLSSPAAQAVRTGLRPALTVCLRHRRCERASGSHLPSATGVGGANVRVSTFQCRKGQGAAAGARRYFRQARAEGGATAHPRQNDGRSRCGASTMPRDPRPMTTPNGTQVLSP